MKLLSLGLWSLRFKFEAGVEVGVSGSMVGALMNT